MTSDLGCYWQQNEDYAAYLRDEHDDELERMERDLDAQARDLPLPLPQMSPLARMVELHGMSPRDPDLPTGVLDEAA